MPNYNPPPFGQAPQLLIPGFAAFLFGSCNAGVSPSKLRVTSAAVAANVATLGVVLFEGAIPAVGSLLCVAGLQTITAPYTSTYTLTAVSIAGNGTGTVSFALAAANQATTPDAGLAIVPQPIGLETVAAGASVAVAQSNNSFGGDLDKTVTAQAIFGTVPGSATIVLQGSMVDNAADYVTVGMIANVTGSAVTANGLTVSATWLFYRALVSGVTGNGTLAVLIEA